ncbi:MAG: type II toxin-antitoxin system HipA family toxin [Sphingobacteriales bacterium]|nr:MAG: type II toxin-antitoxin system HipA family toxin [Sphingobacteriales bacterium]
MAKNKLITLHCFDEEVGLLGFDENRGASSFQYNEAFLSSGKYSRLFPFVFKRTKQTQVFDRYNNGTFRGLPPMIADSLPDLFGNIIFKTWMESRGGDVNAILVLEQLAYVGTRGMGALEYQPSKSVSANDTIDIAEITEVVRRVLNSKGQAKGKQLDHTSLLNIFKIGTSAGGMRPKILVSQHKETGAIIPGDIIIDESYHHYLIKLGIDEDVKYSRELVEYSYYQAAATHAGIHMMGSRMIDDKHFATLRFDRQQGKKKHILTVTGMTGLDYKDPKMSSYENIFDLLIHLKCPHKDVAQLFRRMVFNLVFCNHDDHLKNQSLIYDELSDSWSLAPAYDLTYSLNPELNMKTTSRALSINGKRVGIELKDLKQIADKYTIKNPTGIIAEIQAAVEYWKDCAATLGLSSKVVQSISKNFVYFV